MGSTSQPPPTSAPNPTLKDPVSRNNKAYYNLQFPLTAQGDLAAITIQCLCLAKFLTIIHHMDETAVLLPYKSFYTLNGEVLYEPNNLGQVFTAESKYFQGFHSQHPSDTMYVSILSGFDSTWGGLLQEPPSRNGEPITPNIQLLHPDSFYLKDWLVVPLS